MNKKLRQLQKKRLKQWWTNGKLRKNTRCFPYLVAFWGLRVGGGYQSFNVNGSLGKTVSE